MSLIQGFNKLASTLTEYTSFRSVRKKFQEQLASRFLTYSKQDQDNFIETLYKWSTNRMHSTNNVDKIIALACFAYILDIVEDQTHYQNIANQLERILPVESIIVIDGVTFLLERVARRSETPILPTLFERLTSRIFSTSVLSSVFIFKNVIFTDIDLYRRFSGHINHIVYGAIKHQESQVRACGVELFLGKINHDSSPDECANTMLDDCFQALESPCPLHVVDGYFSMIEGIIRTKPRLLAGRAQILTKVVVFQMNQQSMLTVLNHVLAIQEFRNFTPQFQAKLLTIFSEISQFSEEVSQLLSKLLNTDSIDGEAYAPLIFKLPDECFFIVAPSLLRKYNNFNDQIYSRLKVAQITIDVLKTAKILSEQSTIIASEISETYSQYIRENFTSNLTISYEIIKLISLDDSIDKNELLDVLIKQLSTVNEKDSPNLIQAIYTLILSIEDKQKYLMQTLFLANSSSNSDLRLNSIELIPQELLCLFNSPLIYDILNSFISDQKSSVRQETQNLLLRIQKVIPDDIEEYLKTNINLFFHQLQGFTSLVTKRYQLELTPIFIRLNTKIIKPYVRRMVEYFINILEERCETPKSTLEATLKLNDKNNTRIIHKCVLKSINELIPHIDEFKDLLSKLINAITNQLTISSHKSLHVEVANTLLLIFRAIDFHEIFNEADIVKMHKEIFSFLSNCSDFETICGFFRLFGTIGPLEPTQFHTFDYESHSFDWSPICDVSKRQTCYLNFVMQYVLDQLQQSSSIYEPSVLIIAIVYIFQSDPFNSLPFLPQIVPVFSKLLNDKVFNPPDAIFHFLRSIILLVDVSILPYGDNIMEMILPFLHEANLPAIKVFSALVFALKGNYKYDPAIFNLFVSILRQKNVLPEVDNYIMLTLALMVIYNESSPSIFFELASQRIKNNNKDSITYLCWIMNTGKFQSLVLQVLRLALSIKGPLELKAHELISVIYAKNPKITKIVNFPKENLLSVNETDYQPKPDIVPSKMRPASQRRLIDTILSHQNVAEYTPIWILQLTQDLVLCSSSAAIRACRPLLNGASKLQYDIFPLALVSVWEDAQDEERRRLMSFFETVVSSPNANLSVLSVIVDGAEALDRAGFSMFYNPMTAGKIAEKCKSWFKAIRFFSKVDFPEEPLKHLLMIEAQLKRKSTANGLLGIIPSQTTDAGLFESLNKWDKALEIYETQKESETSVPGIVNCYMNMDDYASIISKDQIFEKLVKETKIKAALPFFIAALNTGQETDKYEQFLVPDTPTNCCWRAICKIKKNLQNEAEEFVNRATNAAVINFSPPANYENAMPLINDFFSIEDVRNILDVNKNKENSKHIIEIWKRNSNSMKNDYSQLKLSWAIRELLECTPEQRRDMKNTYLDILRRIKEWTYFDGVFQSIEKDERSLLIRYITRYDRGIVKNTDELAKFVSKLQKSQRIDVYCDAVCDLATRTVVTVFVVNQLGDVLRKNTNHARAWRLWTYTNLSLMQKPGNVAEFYANNTMNGFWKLLELNGSKMHWLCQLCSLFFTYGTYLSDFENFASKFRNLPPESVILIIPQLVVQLEHPVKEVREVVFDIMKSFSVNHFQAVALPLNLQRHTKSSEFIDQLFNEHSLDGNDVTIFAQSMTSLAVTPAEEVSILLEKLLKIGDDFPLQQESLDIIKRVSDIISAKTYKSFLKDWFSCKPAKLFIEKSARVLNIINSKTANADRVFLFNAANALHISLNKNIESVNSIDIKELGLPIITDDLKVCMPGSYEIGKPLITVSKIRHVLKMIPSAKRPRKMRMLGSNGQSYKYLLKGREDLRLDQHIMQFFSLVNSILRMNKSTDGSFNIIMQYHVVPLTTASGLISWAAGGETLSSLILWRRKICNRTEESEKKVFNEFLYKGRDIAIYMNNLQKLELFRKLVNVAPDNEIDEALWLKSSGARQWLMQTTNFSRSLALMSVVGYIIGLGDRHPLNILFMKRNGNIVHIDLSDCFEKASLRRYVRETVPFRLTRMLVRALGAVGTHGLFKTTAEDVLGQLRRNSQTLLAFLDIFVQEPVIDALWYEGSQDDKEGRGLKQAIRRVAEKLAGNDYEMIMTIPQHVQKLIEEATSEINLSRMYHGWAPYW
ncbi:PIKK family atypical protein kinase [Trichomonas vaginalis G3]|uniref:Serine/threonine-protein kinase TOR n=1 Tax=Trichomonas vaginalis (strain ATCC PRA-98 / G3) TaxID=412133 RepID=A2DVG3_TRIV3|nr:ataxia telangiectasia mutated (ATM) -related family [Trichomonas vaginalis G3]EAY15642.1 PIKK family atypical protein kinase [Trichomonas vaginalis G3]KAI5530248.1 ataxia telangiectasia mutated (ATM) -related family [Trichomonas vaginalis G3]|eukprot:XP_001327865.1 PIKK family atypical protein kinase [Trichomonas vaginalis G3]